MLHSKMLDKAKLENAFELLAKKCKEKNISSPINLYVVGGASILINFDFRKATLDVDAYCDKIDEIKGIVLEISSELYLYDNWINDDFKNTPSYSDKILELSILYKSFDDVVYVYTLEPKYMIAMKLKSSRVDGGDLDDIRKMIFELKLSGSQLSFDEVMEAYDYLYNNDRSYTYERFFETTKKTFDMSVDEVKELLGIDQDY